MLLCLVILLSSSIASPAVQDPAFPDDHRFAETSGIELTEVTSTQVDNLVTLGKVWGFLKYHHPWVTNGNGNWDFELFEVLPEVLDAQDTDEGIDAILAWCEAIGMPDPCDRCAQPPTNVHLPMDLDWIRNENSLGPDLAFFLDSVWQDRHAEGPQHYVSFHPHIGNPDFSNEANYEDLDVPDTGYRWLALLRFWNIIEYWFPYRDVIGGNWDSVLEEFIPRLASAESSDDYARTMIALIARVKDTHANLWSSLHVQPPEGNCQLPVTVRFLEEQAVVVGVLPGHEASHRLAVGDVLRSIDGVPTGDLVKEWSPYYAASNPPTRLRDIARNLTRGPAGNVTIEIEREGAIESLSLERVPITPEMAGDGRTHDRPGDAFQMLSDGVAYLKLGAIEADRIPEYLERAKDTRGWILDIRNYPREFVVFKLGQHLVPTPTPFVRFTNAEPSNPGVFRWTPPLSLPPKPPHYQGKICILIDEASQSQSEYTTMAFRIAPNAVVIGSTTAGADGNISPIPLPGGLRTMISGIGIFYPDMTPTQRIGIVPDIPVRPTRHGIQAGRDEVLEVALREILGDTVSEERVREIAGAGETTAPR